MVCPGAASWKPVHSLQRPSRTGMEDRDEEAYSINDEHLPDFSTKHRIKRKDNVSLCPLIREKIWNSFDYF